MFRTLLMLAIAAALAACAAGEPLAQATGPWRALNPGYWTPAPADLTPRLAAGHDR
jgi:hypothetical protein